MTNKQTILTRAIELAVRKGYTVPGTLKPGDSYLGSPPTWEIKSPFGSDDILRVMIISHMSFGSEWSMHPNEIIFDHSFARAIWGDGITCLTCGSTTFTSRNTICAGCLEPEPVEAWQYHLQQMVIATVAIEYLGANLPGGEDGNQN